METQQHSWLQPTLPKSHYDAMHMGTYFHTGINNVAKNCTKWSGTTQESYKPSLLLDASKQSSMHGIFIIMAIKAKDGASKASKVE